MLVDNDEYHVLRSVRAKPGVNRCLIPEVQLVAGRCKNFRETLMAQVADQCGPDETPMAGNEDTLSISKARIQWEQLRETVGEYAEIVTVDPDPKLPDMVFTANAGVVYGNKAIASHFMPMERRPEEPIFKQWFRDNDFDLFELDEKVGFEGAGDCLLDRGGPWLWTGYGFRSEI